MESLPLPWPAEVILTEPSPAAQGEGGVGRRGKEEGEGRGGRWWGPSLREEESGQEAAGVESGGSGNFPTAQAWGRQPGHSSPAAARGSHRVPAGGGSQGLPCFYLILYENCPKPHSCAHLGEGVGRGVGPFIIQRLNCLEPNSPAKGSQLLSLEVSRVSGELVSDVSGRLPELRCVSSTWRGCPGPSACPPGHSDSPLAKGVSSVHPLQL